MFGKDRWITDGFPHYFLDYRQEVGAAERWADRFTSQPGDWSGNVFDFYYKVYNKLKTALKVPFALDESMRRVDDTPAHKALREAIANCLTNYYERRRIVCVWGDDAITIANPGDFRLHIEEARKPGASDPRNETMLKIFSFVNVGERAGSGMGAIENGWTAGGYATPSYEVAYGPDRTKLTLPLVSAADSTGGERSKAADLHISDNELVVLNLAMETGRITTRLAAEATGLSRQATSSLLRRLADRGLLTWHGKSAKDPRQYYTASTGKQGLQ